MLKIDSLESLNEIKILIDQLLLLIKQIKELCENVEKKGRKLKSDTNIAKSVGTTVSALGGVVSIVGLALIPVTLGVSSILFAAGTIVTSAGSLNNLGTELSDCLITKSQKKKLKRLAIEMDVKTLQLIQKITEMDPENLKDESEFSGPNFGFKFTQYAEEAFIFCKIFKNSYNIADAIKDLLKVTAQATTKAVKAESGAGAVVKTATLSGGKLAFKCGSTIAGVALTALEFRSLYKKWKKNHTLIDFVNDLTEVVNDNQTRLEKLLIKL